MYWKINLNKNWIITYNLESIYCACEFSLLRAWKVATPYFAGKKNVAKNIESTLNSIINLYHQLCDEYLQKVVQPHVGNLYALSSSINSHNSIDVNIKLFDILGRVAIHGLWSYSYLSKEYFLETESLIEGIRKQQDIIIQLINEIIIINRYKILCFYISTYDFVFYILKLLNF